MNELTLIAMGVAYLAVFALARSHRSFLRALGLTGLLLRVAWRYVPRVSPHRFSKERLWQVIKLLRGGGG